MPLDDVATLVNANQTALLSVNIKHERECVCKGRDVREPASFATMTCYNGGICRDDWEPHPYCECPEGYDGPSCQKTTRTFRENGYVKVERREIESIKLILVKS